MSSKDVLAAVRIAAAEEVLLLLGARRLLEPPPFTVPPVAGFPWPWPWLGAED